jgi:hypothetical protein
MDYWWYTGRRLNLTLAAMRAGWMAPRPLPVRVPEGREHFSRFFAGLLREDDSLPETDQDLSNLAEEARELFRFGSAGSPFELEGPAEPMEAAPRSRTHGNNALPELVMSGNEEGWRPNRLWMTKDAVENWTPRLDLTQSMRELRDQVGTRCEAAGQRQFTLSVGYEVLAGGPNFGRLSLTVGAPRLFDRQFMERWGRRLKREVQGGVFAYRSRLPVAAARDDTPYPGKSASVQARANTEFSLGFCVQDRQVPDDARDAPRYALMPAHALHGLPEDGTGQVVLCPGMLEANPERFGEVARCAWSLHGETPNNETDAALVRIDDSVTYENLIGPSAEAIDTTVPADQVIDEMAGGDRRVWIYGQSMDRRTANLREIDVEYSSILIPQASPNDVDWPEFSLSGAIVVGNQQSRPVQAGASGGPVVDASMRPIGTVCGQVDLRGNSGAIHVAIVAPLPATLDALNVIL